MTCLDLQNTTSLSVYLSPKLLHIINFPISVCSDATVNKWMLSPWTPKVVSSNSTRLSVVLKHLSGEFLHQPRSCFSTMTWIDRRFLRQIKACSSTQGQGKTQTSWRAYLLCEHTDGSYSGTADIWTCSLLCNTIITKIV